MNKSNQHQDETTFVLQKKTGELEMKKLLLLTALLVLTSFKAFSESTTTCFIGIPIDGDKEEFIEKLIEKGYKYNREEDYFTGYFFQEPVYIFIQTVHQKVARLIVYDILQRDEQGIKNRFNTIYHQLEANKRFQKADHKNTLLTHKDNIAYEIKQKSKSYKATFNQIERCSLIEMQQACFVPEGTTPINTDSLSANYRERRRRMHAKAIKHVNSYNKQSYNNQIWFTISEKYGKFALITLFDNVRNLLADRENSNPKL